MVHVWYVKKDGVMKMRKVEVGVGGKQQGRRVRSGVPKPKEKPIPRSLVQDWTFIRMSENWNYSALEKNNIYDDSH